MPLTIGVVACLWTLGYLVAGWPAILAMATAGALVELAFGLVLARRRLVALFELAARVRHR